MAKYPNNLRQLREQSNIGKKRGSKLTLGKIADKLGVAEGTVSRWESGAMGFNVSRVPAIAKAYGVDQSEIFGALPDDGPAETIIPLPTGDILEHILQGLMATAEGSELPASPRALAYALTRISEQIAMNPAIAANPETLEAVLRTAASMLRDHRLQ